METEISEIFAALKADSPANYAHVKRAVETAPTRARVELCFDHPVSDRTRADTRVWEAAGRYFATMYVPAKRATVVYEVWEIGSTGRFAFDPAGKGYMGAVDGDDFPRAVDYLHARLMAE